MGKMEEEGNGGRKEGKKEGREEGREEGRKEGGAIIRIICF